MPDWPTLPAGRKQQFLPLCMTEQGRSHRQQRHRWCLHLKHAIETMKVEPLGTKILSILEVSKDLGTY